MAYRSTKAIFKCADEHKSDLQDATCVFHISVGQPYQEGEKLGAIFDAMNNTLSVCNVVLCDSLQRHTLSILNGGDPKEFYDQAVCAGDQWLERNGQILTSLSVPHKLMRWSEWLSHPNYPDSYEKIKSLYENDFEYKTAVDETVSMFLARIAKRNGDNLVKYGIAFEKCLAYLFEECAIILLLWRLDKYDFVLYPKPRTVAMRATYERMIKPRYPEIMKELYVRFKRVNESNIS
ncbi:MAG: hypothetical protein KAS93_04325 [Gammaproteobacteria bacterium]|nr:hypothetical protein [Gammaproteobacteria bacterium]